MCVSSIISIPFYLTLSRTIPSYSKSSQWNASRKENPTEEEENDENTNPKKPRHFTVSVPPNLNSQEQEVKKTTKKNNLTTLN